MGFTKTAMIAALAIAAAACGSSKDENVMSPEANALEPADVNAALGPDVTTTAEPNLEANDMTSVNDSANETSNQMPPDEPGVPGNNQ